MFFWQAKTKLKGFSIKATVWRSLAAAAATMLTISNAPSGSQSATRPWPGNKMGALPRENHRGEANPGKN
jgi:hypothetical protein